MSAKGYTDKDAVQDYLLETIDGSFNSRLDEWIEGIELYIDKYTGRNFIADSVASTRLFDGKCSNKLAIDECVAITKVEQGDLYGENFTEITSGDYQAIPYNDTPKSAIGLKRTVWGVGIHRITAKWGYSADVPADIKFAATVLVGGIVWNQIRPNGDLKSEEIGNYKITYKDSKGYDDYQNACAILDSYRRITI